MYIDLDTGTVLNGPIMQVDDVETEGMTDSDLIEYATLHGRML